MNDNLPKPIDNPNEKILKLFHDSPLHVLTLVPVNVLKEDPNNAFDDVSVEEITRLEKSMKEDPEFMKDNHLVVNTFEGREGIVIIGNKRLRIAKTLGWEKIYCTFCRVPKNKERARAIIANNHVGSWDRAKLKIELEELRDTGYNLETLTFGADQLVNYMSDDITLDPAEDPEYGGTTPSSKNVICPECGAEFDPKKNKVGDEKKEEK